MTKLRQWQQTFEKVKKEIILAFDEEEKFSDGISIFPYFFGFFRAVSEPKTLEKELVFTVSVSYFIWER